LHLILFGKVVMVCKFYSSTTFTLCFRYPW